MSEQGGERRLLRAATFESVGFVIRHVLRFGRSRRGFGARGRVLLANSVADLAFLATLLPSSIE